jgi:tRNA threonylcarbamoyladenosine biosynthesis protein TsaE
MEALGLQWSKHLSGINRVYLEGPLGAGKTTFVRGLLRGLGYAGAVKSPTFTLVEPYELNGRALYHFDLYRMQNTQELEDIGIRDYFDGQGLCVVEWADKAQNLLPRADLTVMMAPHGNGRRLRLIAHHHTAALCLKALS